MGLQDDNTWDIRSDRKNFIHTPKAFPQEDGTVTLECDCGWGTEVLPYEGQDEKGNDLSKEATDFIPALIESHLLSQEQWPFPSPPAGDKYKDWPNQPPITGENAA